MNFPINAVLAMVTAIACVSGFAVSVAQLRKGFNYRFYWFFAMGWLFATVNFTFMAMGLLFLIGDVVRVSSIFDLLMEFFVLVAADTLKREHVEPVKLAAFLMLCVLIIIFTIPLINVQFTPDIFGTEDVHLDPFLILFKIAGAEIAWVYYCHCTYLINKRAPVALKRYSQVMFAGAFLAVAAIFSCLIFMSMEFYFILASFTAIFMAYAYAREPKLLFVLPFTALRLTVLETRGGLSLFTHTWNQQGNLADESLFSGYLQGISGILKEALKRGDVQEIRVADAIIIAYRNPAYPVAFVLVATRPSRTLRDGLRLFAERFCGEFHTCFANMSNIGQFSGAEVLVKSCFPHVPIYD